MPSLNLLLFKILGTIQKIFAHNVQPISYKKNNARYELRNNSPFKLFGVTNVERFVVHVHINEKNETQTVAILNTNFCLSRMSLYLIHL